MRSVRSPRFLASLVVLSVLGGCAFYGWPHWNLPGWEAFPHWTAWQHGSVVYAGREPPDPPIEGVPDSPGADYVWVAGRWRWHDDNFEWVNGSWQKPPSLTHEWVPGRWEFDLHGWYYVNGRWE